MSSLGSRLEATDRLERRRALRALLARPLVSSHAEPELFRLIVRHRGWLGEWLGDNPGWKLVVDPQSGFARLHRVTAAARGTHAASVAGRTFDKRRYVLVCLTLAVTTLAGAATGRQDTSGQRRYILAAGRRLPRTSASSPPT